MPSLSPPNSQVVGCLRCGGRFRVQNRLVGTLQECPKCGEGLAIPPIQPGESDRSNKTEIASRDDGTKPVGFECRVCQTRMYANVRYVGWKMTCPDCGAKTIVPKPAERRTKKPPAALSGEQYEVWPVDSQPSASELRAAETPSVSFECSLCQTRLTAATDRIGEALTCPDCGAMTHVPAPEPAQPSRWQEGDDNALELDGTFEPPRTPDVVCSTPHDRIHEPDDADRRRTYIRPDGNASDRVGIQWPLVAGVFSLPFQWRAVVRQALLVTWLIVVYWLAASAFDHIMAPAGRVAGGGALMGVPMLVGSIVIGAIWFTCAAACWITILNQSSDGIDCIESWPDAMFVDWMFDGFYVLLAAGVSAFPGWAIVEFSSLSEASLWPVVAGTFLATFPVVLLSMLEWNSPWAVLSPKVVTSFVRSPIAWFFFYMESTVLVATVSFGSAAAFEISRWMVLVVAPFVVAGTFVYFRLLGRLGWCLVRSAPTE